MPKLTKTPASKGKTELKTTFNPQRALELLRLGSGIPTADFRDDQDEAIRHLVEGKGRLLVVQRTGWGKSFVYFIATQLMRENGAGPTLLVSPLLALMRNQIEAAARMGVRAVTINSDNQADWSNVETMLERNQVDVLIISPERLANDYFRSQILSRVAGRIGLLVVDEAHCISDWGHDFRPHYRQLQRLLSSLPSTFPLLATTATANDRVMDDLKKVLGPNLAVLRGDLNRTTLTLQTIRLPTQAQRLAWLAEQVPKIEGSGIIYTLTIRDAERVTNWLRSRGINVEAYTGQTGDRRGELEQALLRNKVKALVATTALGMGYDKPDLAFVIHYQTPGSVVAYYQQVGRAGRALPSAYGVLLSGDEESDINDFFIESAFPTREEVEGVLKALDKAPLGLSVPELLHRVPMNKTRVEKTVQLLSLESPTPITKVGTKWQMTQSDLSEEFWGRAERLNALRREEQAQMQTYVGLTEGHMEFLLEALNGDSSAVIESTLPLLPTKPDPAIVREAETFTRRTSLSIEARKMWPPGGMPLYKVDGRIPATMQSMNGKALCISGDAGWANLVQQGYDDGRFPDEVLAACAGLYKEWNPLPAPAWMTRIPSARHDALMLDFCERLSALIGLPFKEVLGRIAERPEQRTRPNGTQQALNVDGAMEVSAERVPMTNVLLVDDVIGSRWTLTAAAWLLRASRAGIVYPLALTIRSDAE